MFYHHCYNKYNFFTNCGMVPKMVWLNCNWTVIVFFYIMIYVKRNVITNCDLVPVMALVDLCFFFSFCKGSSATNSTTPFVTPTVTPFHLPTGVASNYNPLDPVDCKRSLLAFNCSVPLIRQHCKHSCGIID